MKPDLLVIGLGNIGKEYAGTWHNAGFEVLDVLREKLSGSEWKEQGKFYALISECGILTKKILLVKPTTLMNRSGESVRSLIDFYKLSPSQQILIIVDDVDIPLGTTRYRESGGPGTHNGMKSICDQLGEEFPRLRVGIGPQPEGRDLAEWVLSKMGKSAGMNIQTAASEALEILRS